ncbi:hypothetical protein [Maribacter sp. 4G9]|uniref:hypothetical protein n=1 Tax=Maribacter sp. 4G9 TaxID=1889777 RepID=UPI000F50B747|nr:hypothetical protein [Maribacter sp. 4G9]
MRLHLKKAGLQILVLTLRLRSGQAEQEPYMRLLGWISKHIIVKSKTRKVITEIVDKAGIRRKKALLPGEVSKVTCS